MSVDIAGLTSQTVLIIFATHDSHTIEAEQAQPVPTKSKGRSAASAWPALHA